MCNDVEIWNPVVDYEGIYEVSNFGNIRSLPRDVTGHHNCVIHRKGKTLKQFTDSHGYKFIMLANNGKQKRKFVHRVVAESFLGVFRDMEINHIDGDKSNNNLNNLEWVTHKYNIEHSFAIGLHKKPLVQHMKEIGIKGNKISTSKSSLPILCETDMIAFVSQNATDRYYGYPNGAINKALHNNNGRYRNKKFRLLNSEESHNYDLLS